MTTSPTRADLVPGISNLLADVLGLDQQRRDELTADTQLFGALPELDSLSVLELATTLESTYGVTRVQRSRRSAGSSTALCRTHATATEDARATAIAATATGVRAPSPTTRPTTPMTGWCTR